METGERSTAVFAHVSAVLLPVVAPALLAIVQRKNLFIRGHAMAAVVTSLAWVASAVMIISVDLGRLSIDEDETSTGGLVALLVLFVAVVILVVTNIGRARSGRPPVGKKYGGWRRSAGARPSVDVGGHPAWHGNPCR